MVQRARLYFHVFCLVFFFVARFTFLRSLPSDRQLAYLQYDLFKLRLIEDWGIFHLSVQTFLSSVLVFWYTSAYTTVFIVKNQIFKVRLTLILQLFWSFSNRLEKNNDRACVQRKCYKKQSRTFSLLFEEDSTFLCFVTKPQNDDEIYKVARAVISLQ